jgi:hypothetical protein
MGVCQEIRSLGAIFTQFLVNFTYFGVCLWPKKDGVCLLEQVLLIE